MKSWKQKKGGAVEAISRRAAFTLVEMLVATLVTGAAAAALKKARLI